MATAVFAPIVAARVGFGVRADASRAVRRGCRVAAPPPRHARFTQTRVSHRRGAFLTVAAAPDDVQGDEGADATSFFSPSKVNLFLRIIRKRDDGFHDLASLFHVIDLGDAMKFAKSSSKTRDTLVCADDTIPLDGRNLVIKALDLFRRKTGTSQYFWVELVKNVPHGAGLGGGSGNAATAMWAANQLCGTPASEAELLEWRLKVTPRHYPTPIPGTHHEVLPIVQSNYSYKLRSQLTLFVGHNRSGDIGSDISVFFSLGAAYCTGRGEVVEDVESPLPLSTPLLLVKPNLGLSTPQIFKALDLAGLSKLDPLALMEGIKKDGCSFDICVNDLEAPAFSELPELLELKNKLVEACSETVVFMSGSGSTIVVVGNDAVPKFVADDPDLFKAQTRLITRKKGEWFAPSTEY